VDPQALQVSQELSGLLEELGSLQIRQQLQLKITKKVGITPEQAAIVDNMEVHTGDQDLSGLASSSSVNSGLATKVDKAAGDYLVKIMEQPKTKLWVNIEVLQAPFHTSDSTCRKYIAVTCPQMATDARMFQLLVKFKNRGLVLLQ
jgi:hypothetical protein